MTAIAARLAEPLLQTRITSIARRYGADAEDVRQYVTLCLMEKAAAEPTFAEQQIGYLIKYAAWSARHFAEKARTYDQYVECEPMVADEDGDAASIFDELVAAEDLTPEQAVIQREHLAALAAQIAALAPKQQAVARLLAGGYEPSEIAERLGMSRSSVSHLIARMRTALMQ